MEACRPAVSNEMANVEVEHGHAFVAVHAAAWHHPSAKAPESRMNKETGTGQLGLGEGA